MNKYDGQMDKECIALCDALNEYPHVSTFESCCGHFKQRFMVFFRCDDFITLGKLFRCVNRNYSCGEWEILVDGTDTTPCCCFWLRSIDIFENEDRMNNALANLIDNLHYYLHECPEHIEKYFQINNG